MSDNSKAQKVPAHEVYSTVKSSEFALGQQADRKADNEARQAQDTKKSDIRNREDIDRAESIDRFIRELELVDDQISEARLRRRHLLQSILAFRAGLPMPDKKLVTAKDEDLQAAFEGKKPEAPKAPEPPKVEEKASDKPAQDDAKDGEGS